LNSIARGYGVNAAVSLLSVICAVVVADAFAAGPNASAPDGQSPSQLSSVARPEAVAQSPAPAPTASSAISAATPDPSSSGKPDTDAKPSDMAASPVTADAQPMANKSERKVLVDDTVTDAQLKQILAQGYRPEKQVYGNEVLYCRKEQLAGDRFQTKVCKTAVRIFEDQRRGKAFTNSMQQMSLTTPR
jgi:hypothetical protein